MAEGSRDAAEGSSYRRGAATLSLGVGATGLITYAYFSIASHALSDSEYGAITLLWSAVFITVNVLYRPVEQLLSRTIADRDARGRQGHEHFRVAATIELALGALFVAGALALRGPLQDNLLDGSTTFYWVFVVAVLAYAASYFARGLLAGRRLFALYGGVVVLEATTRLVFALVVAWGVASSWSVVALGIAAAPIASLAIVAWALGSRLSRTARRSDAERPPNACGAAAWRREPAFTLAHGLAFAGPVLLMMLSEQAFLNAGPLLVKATEGEGGTALAGFTFNVLLLARAPLQLFQAVQTSILPHLTRLSASGVSNSFRRSVAVTTCAIAIFSAVEALVLLAAGPELMDLAFGGGFDYAREGLVLIACGTGAYLAASTLNQAALAAGRAREAGACWVVSAAAFVGLLLLPGFDDRVLQVEIGYMGSALLLCALLYRSYRRGS